MFDDIIWVEKYRPRTVDDCILPKNIESVARGFIEKGKLPNLLLSGSAGTGKTTLALALCNTLGYDTLMINGSNEGRLVETLRGKIADFASSVSFSGSRKVVIIDEADYTPADTVQAALRNFIEEFSSNCGFILTCNFPNRLIEPIHSRTTHIDYTIPPTEKSDMAKKMFSRVCDILSKENIEYDKKAVAEVIKINFPDFRRTLNDFQRYASTGKIDSGIFRNSSAEQIDELIKYLSEKDFSGMRKWVANSTNMELHVVCRKLYDKMYDMLKPETIPQLVIDMADYQYKNSFVADKEINMVAMLTTIMMNCEFK